MLSYFLSDFYRIDLEVISIWNSISSSHDCFTFKNWPVFLCQGPEWSRMYRFMTFNASNMQPWAFRAQRDLLVFHVFFFPQCLAMSHLIWMLNLVSFNNFLKMFIYLVILLSWIIFIDVITKMGAHRGSGGNLAIPPVNTFFFTSVLSIQSHDMCLAVCLKQCEKTLSSWVLTNNFIPLPFLFPILEKYLLSWYWQEARSNGSGMGCIYLPPKRASPCFWEMTALSLYCRL